jgi:HD-like signal output (HDOD) protein
MCGSAVQRKPVPAVSRSLPPREIPNKATKGIPPRTNVNPPARTIESRAVQAEPAGDGIARTIKIIQNQQNIPAFSHHIFEVMGMMGNNEASVRRLTNTIVRDYSLTLTVLRVANSAYYNRSGKPICSVARAVTLMGVDAVKNLAGGMMLLEHYEKHSAGLKRLILLSMLTANHSQQVALRLQLPMTEEAYLCGMFRNLGEILVGCHLADQYEVILREISENKLTEREACMKVLHFSYEDLGRTVAADWSLPGSVSLAMESSDPITYNKQSADEKLYTVVALSHELTNAVYRRPPEDKAKAIDLILGKYGAISDLCPQMIQEVLADTVTQTQDTFSTVGIPLDELQLRNQCQIALSHRHELKDAAATPPFATSVASSGKLPAGIEVPMRDEDLLEQLVAEVKAAVEPANEPKLNEVLMMAMEACHRGARFDRVVFCLATPDRTAVRGRLGLGASIDEVIENLQIPLAGQRESLTLALLTKRDLFIDALHDDRYQDSVLVRTLGACCFGLYPLVVDHVVVGCLYFDRMTEAPLPSQAILDTLGRLRDLLADLIRRTRVHV